MKSQNQHHVTPVPAGRVDVPGILYGSTGLALSFALYWIGLFKRADAWLFDLLHTPLFHDGVPGLPSRPLLVLCTAIFCYGVAYAVLDSSALWRRVVLGITAMVLTLAMIPAFAVWNVYFSPFLQIVGVFWSWFCVVIYTQHHHMPCDGVEVDLQMSAPEPELMQPLQNKFKEPVTMKKKTPAKKPDTEDKYKPSAESNKTKERK